MKKMITFAALTAISTSASAFDYKFNLEGRADFVNSNLKTTAQAGTTKEVSQNSFMSNIIRLNMMGNINESLTYRMRYRFNQVPEATARDNSTNSLDYLYVDHKNSLFTTRFGKTNWAEAYGRESFISSTDLFINTAAYNAYNANIGNYRFGVSATTTFMDSHKFTLAISNPNSTITDTGAEQKNTSLAYAAHYSSVMFDKIFQPTLSYTTAHQDGDQNTGRKAGNSTMWAAGFRTEVESLIIDVDYKQFAKENDNTLAAVNAKANGKTNSVFANVAYNMAMSDVSISPFVQYANDKFKGQNSVAVNNDKNTYVAGVMFKPYTDVNFRYHLAYSLSKQKFDDSAAANKEVKDNKIIFGIKADI